MKASTFALALAISQSCQAIRLPLQQRSELKQSLGRRAQIKASGAPVNTSEPVALSDTGDTRYFANITIGSEDKLIVVDTGSTDLVIFSTIAGAVDTGVTSSVTYAAGTVSGNIFAGTVEFANQEIHHQAFLSTGPLDGFPGDGIMGIALFSESSIELALNNPPGASPFLDNVFLNEPSTPNYVTFLLQRLDDPDQNVTAELTIGEIVPGYENVTSMPQNPVQAASESGHWTLLLDSVIGPDGNAIPYTSIVQGAPASVAILDTGAPFVLVPKVISDAFYSNATGAFVDSVLFGGQQDVWVVDCTAELSAQFSIGNVTYNIHPLDMTIPFTSENGTDICIGAFVPNQLDPSFAFFDFLLGDPFLRNVYALLNYGDFIAGKTDEVAAPYVQLMPLTTLDVAHKEFTDARLSNSTSSPPPTSSDTNTTVPTSGDVSKDISLDSVKTAAQNAADKAKHIAIIVASVVGGVVILGILLCLVCCCGLCGLTSRKRSFGFRGQETREVYRPLHAPAPISHPDEYGHEGKGSLY